MILVTGASRGIGQYIFNYYFSKGEEVLGIYNTTKPTHNQDRYVQLDITDESAIQCFIEEHSLEHIVLVNVAGITLSGIAHKADVEQFEKTMEVNTISTFRLIRHILPLMREQQYGRIINISSVVPQVGTPGNVAYAASKSALWGMSKVIAVENATKGVTSNCINLGYCTVGMVETIPQSQLDKIIESIPKKSLCPPHNITNAIDFLIASEYVTGTEININGGQY